MTSIYRPITYRVTETTVEKHIGAVGRVTLGYDAARPFEISMDFGANADGIWRCHRDILDRRIVGRGDVACHVDGLWFYLTLSTPGGRVVMRVLEADVSAFLSATKRLVPREAEVLDFDAELLALLGGGR